MFSGKARGVVTTGSHKEDIILACYADPLGNIGGQVLIEYKHVLLQPGESGHLSIKLPDNQKGETCAVQCDLVSGRKTPKTPPFYTRDELIAFGEVGKGECISDTPSCTDCGGCTKTPDPSKEGLECEWLGSEICLWGCKCVPTEEPECPEQKWSYESCSYVGGCVCTPEGKKECETQTWDYEKCAYVGACVCEPVGEKECPEQTWSESKCEYVGDCPEELVCHVSNKGTDGNWNIQESQKTMNPGHASHFSNCPPDYEGTCDGRFNQGAPCQN